MLFSGLPVVLAVDVEVELGNGRGFIVVASNFSNFAGFAVDGLVNRKIGRGLVEVVEVLVCLVLGTDVVVVVIGRVTKARIVVDAVTIGRVTKVRTVVDVEEIVGTKSKPSVGLVLDFLGIHFRTGLSVVLYMFLYFEVE